MLRRSLPLLLIAAVALLTTPYAVAQPGRGGPGALLRQYQQALQDARNQGVDTRQAEQLADQSRKAAQGGNTQQAQQLLQQAIGLLRPQRGNASPAAKTPPAAGGGQATVYVLAFTHHYSGPGGYYATPAEVRGIGAFFHKYAIPGTLCFDGILVQRLQSEDPGIFAQINEWKLPLGYHGEETHGPYPVPSDLFAEAYGLREAQGFSGKWSLTTGLDWEQAVSQTIARYTHHIPWNVDENTRMLDRRRESSTDLSRVGGLALVQKAFGRDVSMMPSHALECAPEGYAFRTLSSFGLDQPAVPTAAHALRIYHLEQYEDAVMAVAGADTSIFWHMGRLTNKGDEIGESGHLLRPVQAKLASLDRSRPRLMLMGFSHLQEDTVAPTVRYLNEEFFPANPGSRWVSGDTLPECFEPEKGYAPTAADLRVISQTLLASWSRRPPDMVRTPGRDYSLCDAYEGLAQALAQHAATGKLPERVELKALYGPVAREARACLSAARSMPLRDLAAAAQAVCTQWPAKGDRFVPATTRAGWVTLNAAELIQAMASAYLAVTNGSQEAVSVSPATLFPPYADTLDKVFQARNVAPLCYTKGQLWTIKPAVVRDQQAATQTPSAGQSPTQTPPVAQAPANSEGRVLVVFASNLQGAGRCYREEPFGADLYSVTYDLRTGQASDLRRLTQSSNSAEWFPTISPDGAFVAYNATQSGGPRGSANSLRFINLATGADSALAANGRFPCFSADGARLAFSMTQGSAHRLLVAPVERYGQDGLRLGQAQVVADERLGLELIEDPCFFPKGTHLAFHVKPDARTSAAVGTIGVNGSDYGCITSATGAGHATTCPVGSAVAYTQSSDGRAMMMSATNRVWGTPTPLPVSTDPGDYASFDSRYAGVPQVRASYLEWIAPDLILVTSHGSDTRGQFSFARLYLLQLATGGGQSRLHDLSGAIEALAGTKGRDFCTADGLLLEASAAGQ
ncbi:MAG: hypothetical protein ABFD94_14295 [Armatimonadia bacterium]